MNKILPARLRVTAIILLFLIGLNALAAGYGFITDPSGKALGISLDYIRYAPFESFLVPGIVLFLVNGVMSMITGILTICRGWHYPDLIYLQGIVLMGWIIVQVIMVRDFNLLHFSCLAIGVVLTVLGRRLKQDYPVA